MAITIQNHTKTIASKVVGTFVEDKPVLAGFSGFFPRETAMTLQVDLEVQRDNDSIAVDVKRFTEGNKNKFSIVTEKKFQPPYFREEYDFQNDEVYMSTIALGVGLENSNVNAIIAQNALKKIRKMRSKIERSIRKQQADVMQTGIVELINGDSIDYKRKAASMVDLGASQYFTNASADPLASLKNAGTFLRDVGASSSMTLNMVMRGEGLAALLTNPKFEEKANNRRINRADVQSPEFNAVTGFAFHGQVSAGDFNINLWTYNQKYTKADGTTAYYLDANKAVFIPDDFMAKTVFGGLPNMVDRQIGGENAAMPSITEAEFLLRAYSDSKTMSSTLEITSAPLAMPITIDRIYTAQVLE